MTRYTVFLIAMLLAPATMAEIEESPISREHTTGAPEKTDQKPAQPKTADRGELLYENHCQACHESLVHIRNNRRAGSIEAVRTWVRRWSKHLKLQWRDEEINDVVLFLSRRYYKFNIQDN